MSALPHILKKEFRQIFRNRVMLPIIFVLPILQLLILVNAADFEIKNVNIVFQDGDHAPTSHSLIAHFEASPQFKVLGTVENAKEGFDMLARDKVTVLLRIPPGFERDLRTTGTASLALDVNGIDGSAAGLSAFYVTRIVQSFNKELIVKWGMGSAFGKGPIEIKEMFWYNQDLDYKNFMLPGLLVLLITMVVLFLSSMNVVREIEMGTIEQINVTPIHKYEFIIGKLLPFWIIGMFELALGLVVGIIAYSIPIKGNVLIIFAFAAIYLPVVLGMGLLVSTRTKTQQQAMFVSWFFMVIFLLMSGLFTAIENMPLWAQKLTWFNPTAYFIEVTRLVLLKGSNFADVARHFGVITIFAVVLNALAVWSYKKRS